MERASVLLAAIYENRAASNLDLTNGARLWQGRDGNGRRAMLRCSSGHRQFAGKEPNNSGWESPEVEAFNMF